MKPQCTPAAATRCCYSQPQRSHHRSPRRLQSGVAHALDLSTEVSGALAVIGSAGIVGGTAFASLWILEKQAVEALNRKIETLKATIADKEELLRKAQGDVEKAQEVGGNKATSRRVAHQAPPGCTGRARPRAPTAPAPRVLPAVRARERLVPQALRGVCTRQPKARTRFGDEGVGPCPAGCGHARMHACRATFCSWDSAVMPCMHAMQQIATRACRYNGIRTPVHMPPAPCR